MDKKLDNFESFIKSSLEGHEAAYSASAWESMEQALGNNAIGTDGFESFIKNSLDNHEAPYSPSAWKTISALLVKTTVPFYKTKLFIGLASAVVITGVLFTVLPNEKVNSKVIAKNNVIKKSEATQNTSNNNTTTNTNEVIGNLANETNDLNTEKNDKNIGVTKNDITSNTPTKTDKTAVDNKTSVPNKNGNVIINNDTQTPEPIVGGVNDKVYDISFLTVTAICEGESIQLTPKTIDNELLYKWLLNDKVISNEASTSIVLNNAGVNNIDLIAYKDGKIIGSRTKDITVNETPKNNIIVNNNQYALVNEHTFAFNGNIKTASWSFGDGEISKEIKTNHTYKKQGKYTLAYSLTSDKGCSASFQQPVIVKGYYNIRQDHFFSPDGDGSLDMFIPEELKEINQPFEMVVYNRQNQLIFKTNDINTPWNGRDLEGNMVPFGIYVWVVNVTNEFGFDEVYKGSVTKASN